MAGSLPTAGGTPGRASQPIRSAGGVATDHVMQVPTEFLAHVLVLQRELHRGLEVVELVPDVVAPVIEPVRVYRLLLREQVDSVRQLKLAAAARLDLPQRIEDVV